MELLRGQSRLHPWQALGLFNGKGTGTPAMTPCTTAVMLLTCLSEDKKIYIYNISFHSSFSVAAKIKKKKGQTILVISH